MRRGRRGREGRAREGRLWFRLGDDSNLEVLEPGVLLGSGSPGRVGSSEEGGHEDLEKEEEKRRGGGEGGLATRREGRVEKRRLTPSKPASDRVRMLRF